MKKLILGIFIGIALVSLLPTSNAQTDRDGRWMFGYEVLNSKSEIVCEDPYIIDSMKTIECE